MGQTTRRATRWSRPQAGTSTGHGATRAEGTFYSWTTRVAPYLELGNAAGKFNTRQWPWWQYLPGVPAVNGNEVNAVQAKIMQCPSDSRINLLWNDGSHSAALTSYFGVSGRDQFKESIVGSGSPSSSAKLPGQDGLLYANSSVRLTGISDGSSNTLIVGERPPSNTLLYGWMWAGVGDWPFFGATDIVLGVRERAGSHAAAPDYYRPGSLNDPQDVHRYHFWSLHPGGGLWLLADGSVRYISYSAGTQNVTVISGISVMLLEAMASRAGGEVFDQP